MALTAEQLAARDEACAWLRFANQDRDGHTVAARLEAAFPAEDPAPAPEPEP